MTKDLFALMKLDRMLTPAERKALFHRVPKSNGRASSLPGPRGETCGSCKHLECNAQYSKRFYKCGLLRWTHGPGTDIRLKDPSCSRWEPKPDGE
jgi:hypothetical protein